MATSTGKKEYTLKINGVTQSLKEVIKLEDALINLDDTIGAVNKNTVTASTTSKAQAKALTEEEKAAKKLADTKEKIEKANSEANKAQIAATQQLRERTREITRQIQINSLAEGSVKSMGMQLTDLRNEYEGLSAAERDDLEVGGQLLTQIQALDKEYKKIRESTGNFRDSVGNYEKAKQSLEDIQAGLDGIAESTAAASAETIAGGEALDMFGGAASAASEATAKLSGITTVLMQAQQVYIQVVKENIIQEKAAAVIDTIRAIQLKAKAAAEVQATKGTIAATIAQKAFNLVAAANPYVLLALALIAVGAALYAFIGNTEKAAEEQKQLNDLQSVWLDMLDREAGLIQKASDERVAALQRQLNVMNALGDKQKEVRKLEDDIAKERARNNLEQRQFYSEEIKDLDANIKKLEDFMLVLDQLNAAKAVNQGKVTLDIDLDGKVERVDVEEAIAAVQGTVDNLNRKINIATTLTTDQKEIEAQARVTAAQRLKADKELAKQRAELELSAIRAAEDARISLIENSYAEAVKIARTQTARQIQDLRKTLAEEKNLTDKARAAINDNIVSLQKRLNLTLKALKEEQLAKDLEAERAAEDSRTAIIKGQMLRRQTEINASYDRQIQDYNKKLETDKNLTKAQQKAISEIILNAEKARAIELQTLQADDLQKRADLELSAIDAQLDDVRARVGETLVRDKEGLKLIDVDATRKNLAAVNLALSDYITGLKKYQQDLKVAHDATLATLQEGTPEYEAEMQKYSRANEDAARRIIAAQKEQTLNTKESTKAQIDYYKELFEEIAKLAAVGSDVVGGIMDTYNMGIQAQLDNLQKGLETINEQYEAAKEQREEAVKNVEELEAQMQAATGGTSEALQEQLQDAMHARNEADREEKRLAKEKEKREAEIAKKEKQMRRNDLIAGIAGAIANTAQGVTKALTLVFPLNLVVAGIVGALGLAQVGIMSKQLTKLEKGGYIKGPSHARGGVRIPGTNIEAEGDEFVVNKKSTAANRSLIEFVNSSPDTVTAADLAGVVPSDTTPVIGSGVSRSNNDDVIDAINSMEFKPVVAVTDIMDVQNDVVKVRDLSGF